jgi:predicted DNA-binding transcriptional regulator YafY
MSFAKAQDLFRLAEMAKARYRGVALRDIMEEFAVNERTARRMARALEDVFPRIDVVTDDERRRWWSLREVDYIRHRGFRDSEIAALDLAIRRAERDGAANEVKSLTEMRDRLLASASPPQARSAEVSSEVMLEANGFACRPGPASQAPTHYLKLLFEAFIAPMSIRMTYRSARDDAPRERVVEPYGVILGTRHYLVARDTTPERRIRQYRFDRISDMAVTGQGFVRDPDFCINAHCAQSFGSFFSEAEHGPVRWRFAPSAAPVARDFRFHPNQVLTGMPDGSLLVEFSASGWVEMAWCLISWGRAVEVLEPPELRVILERVRRGDVDILP